MSWQWVSDDNDKAVRLLWDSRPSCGFACPVALRAGILLPAKWENEKVCTVGAEWNGEIEIAVCGKYYSVRVE